MEAFEAFCSEHTRADDPAVKPIPVISSGTYIVGDEIAAGIYRVAGYWALLDSDFEIIDNDGVYDDGLTLFNLTEGGAAYVEIGGEAVALADAPALDALTFTEGTYLVCVDIEPGTYRISDPDYAYAARLDSTLDIIDNEGNAGNVLIRVQDGDFAFSFSGEIERIE